MLQIIRRASLSYPHIFIQVVKMSTVGKLPSPVEVQFPVPWGHIAGKAWGDPSGKRVLAVHGWLDNAGSFDTLVPLLSTDLHVVAIDWPGHGKSSHRPRGAHYNAIDYVADMKYVIDALKWDQFTLIGHSLGGGAASWFTGCQPDLVEKLVLLEGGGFSSYDAADMPRGMGHTLNELLQNDKLVDNKTFPTWDAVIDKVHEAHQHMQSSFSREAAAVLAVRGTEQLENGGYRFTRDLRVKRRSLMRVTLDMNNAFLSAIQCPVLLIRGEESYISSLFMKVPLDSINPGKLQQLIVPGGHHVHLENPELISPAMNSFFEPTDCHGKL